MENTSKILINITKTRTCLINIAQYRGAKVREYSAQRFLTVASHCLSFSSLLLEVFTNFRFKQDSRPA